MFKKFCDKELLLYLIRCNKNLGLGFSLLVYLKRNN